MTGYPSLLRTFKSLAAVAALGGCASEGSFSVDPTPTRDDTSAIPAGADASTPSKTQPSNTGGQDAQAEEPTASRCEVGNDTITCTSHELSLQAMVVPRKIFYELPLGTPPAKGWPVVFFFQGSFFSADTAFSGSVGDSFGRYDLARTIKELLDHGYAIIAPNATGNGNTAWQTNIPPWMFAWETSSDHAFLLSIFDGIKLGAFGPLDDSRLYATGISSGGFMTSRMAVSYPGKFKALAIHSASYATCGAVCSVPTSLPTDHPPTLFLHGGEDLIVSPDMMIEYRDELTKEGHTVKTVVDPGVGHAWLPTAPGEVRAWFDASP